MKKAMLRTSLMKLSKTIRLSTKYQYKYEHSKNIMYFDKKDPLPAPVNEPGIYENIF